MPSRFEVEDTQRIKKLRAYFVEQLPLPCWRCGTLIDDRTLWDLGHRHDLALGGDQYDVWPEHRHAVPGVCVGNRGAGSQVRSRQIAASREW